MDTKNDYYNYSFGSMGRTRETAVQSHFFQWFHLEIAGQQPKEPGLVTTFRPSGEAFHSVCSLDTLAAPNGDLVQMDLVVRRSFLDGRNRLFAQDLVKSFLVAVLPDACQHLLEDFMREMQTPDESGRATGHTPGWRVFRGWRSDWSVQTGWSQLSLTNVELAEGNSLVVSVRPNPEAPNGKKIESKRGGMGMKLLTFLGFAAMLLCSCSKPSNITPEASLKGDWKASLQRVSNCGQPAPLALQEASLEIREAPLLNRAVSSFNLTEANVTGTVTMSLRMEPNRPQVVTSGLLVGQIVKDPASSGNGSAGLRLEGYILSPEEYGAWIAKNKPGSAPPDAGEVELAISGDPVRGYRLNGEVRSGATCSNFTHLGAVANDLTGHFGRSVPATWTVTAGFDRQ
jgi:hypothetical protein